MCPWKSWSQAGHLIVLIDNTNSLNIISWSSKRIDRVCTSTFQAETMACVTACDVALFVQGIIREITHRTCPIILVLDHKGCFESITSVAEVKERMQSLYINRLREHLAKREIERVVWVPATAQMANILTKRVSTKEKRSFLLNLQVNKVDPPKGAIVRSGSLAVVGNKEREENPGEYQINNQIERAQRTAAQPVHHKH
mmetsp:Transcript_7781/g.13766  ORF Transcript_7781/g.13766 Transcript_7781/m.13766 type:complete len:199 (-) Transcript_7781:1105-1701(-)